MSTAILGAYVRMLAFAGQPHRVLERPHSDESLEPWAEGQEARVMSQGQTPETYSSHVLIELLEPPKSRILLTAIDQMPYFEIIEGPGPRRAVTYRQRQP